jgi:hypothetical protein
MTNRLFYITLGAALLLCACPTDTSETPSRRVEQPVVEPDEQSPVGEWGEEPAAAAGRDKPRLLSGDVVYDAAGQVSAVFTFNMDVNIAVPSGWEAVGNGTQTVTVVPDGGGSGPRLLAFTAENSADSGITTEFAGKEIIVASGTFDRPATPAVYTAQYADEYGAAGIVPDGGDTQWVYISEDDPGLRAMLRAAFESGAPALFHISIAQTDGGDSVEISGTELPAQANSYVIIDIGLPDDPEANSLLPGFSIPFKGLGEDGGDYRHIVLRVNGNASLVIRAGNPDTDYGYLTGARVEVRAGGKLRSEAPVGFPLGTGSIARISLNSYFAAGTGDGWTIGPARADPVIVWDTGDQNGSYVEIREVETGPGTWEGRIAFDVHLTVKKPLRLEYSLWFIGGPSLTVAIPESYGNERGVFSADGKNPKFYGSSSFAGGHNIARPAAKIILRPGNSLSKCLIQDGATDTLTAGSNITIPNRGSNGSPVPFTSAYGDSYLNWEVPQ